MASGIAFKMITMAICTLCAVFTPISDITKCYKSSGLAAAVVSIQQACGGLQDPDGWKPLRKEN